MQSVLIEVDGISHRYFVYQEPETESTPGRPESDFIGPILALQTYHRYTSSLEELSDMVTQGLALLTYFYLRNLLPRYENGYGDTWIIVQRHYYNRPHLTRWWAMKEGAEYYGN
jgi:hypothetical protein